MIGLVTHTDRRLHVPECMRVCVAHCMTQVTLIVYDQFCMWHIRVYVLHHMIMYDMYGGCGVIHDCSCAVVACVFIHSVGSITGHSKTI